MHNKQLSELEEHFLKRIGHADVSKEALECKEDIFASISQRIKCEETEVEVANRGKRKVFRISWRSNVAAVLLLVLMIGGGVGGYMYGYWMGHRQLTADVVTLQSPDGAIARFTLADGTQVVLNGNTTMKYPAVFVEDKREISLSGEAFFEVAKNKEKPFIIHTGGMDVEVLGTKFNLKSVPDGDVCVTLEEGSVLASCNLSGYRKEVYLTPNHQVLLDRETGEMKCTVADPQLAKGWMYGNLYFQDSTLAEIASTLEARFNTQILISDDGLANQRFYCQFGQGDTLERILFLLSYKGGFKYSLKKNQVLIFK